MPVSPARFRPLLAALAAVLLLPAPALAARIDIGPRAELLCADHVVEGVAWARVPPPRTDPPPGPWKVLRLVNACGPAHDPGLTLVRVGRRYKGDAPRWIWVTGRYLEPGRGYRILLDAPADGAGAASVRFLDPRSRTVSRYASWLDGLHPGAGLDSVLVASLVRQVASGSDSLLDLAARDLGYVVSPQPRLEAVLDEVLRTGTPAARARVAGVLHEGTPGLAVLLRRAERDTSWRVRRAVAGTRRGALAGFLLGDPDVRVRRRAARCLEYGRGDEPDSALVVAALLAARRDADAEVRATAYGGLFARLDRMGTELWHEARRDPAGAVRLRAYHAANRRFGPDRAASLYAEACLDPDPAVRVFGLGKRAAKGSAAAVYGEGVLDPDPAVRRAVVAKVRNSSLRREEAGLALARLALGDDDPTVRVEAAAFWSGRGGLPPGWTEEQLLDDLAETWLVHPDIHSAGRALDRLVARSRADERTLQLLRRGARDPDVQVRGQVLCAVSVPCRGDGGLPLAELREILRPLTRDENRWIRTTAWERFDRLGALLGYVE